MNYYLTQIIHRGKIYSIRCVPFILIWSNFLPQLDLPPWWKVGCLYITTIGISNHGEM